MMNANPVTLQPELEVFERHRFELLERAAGKYVLVKGPDIIGTFETEVEAIREGYQRYGNDAFLVKHVLEADVPLNFASFHLGV
jgi:hypothetical protein